MFDCINPFRLYFVQKESPKERDPFDFALIYKFYTNPTETCQRLKYIVRAEAYDDVFAIKFYAARDKNLDYRYNRIVKAHDYKGTLGIFLTCASLVPLPRQQRRRQQLLQLQPYRLRSAPWCGGPALASLERSARLSFRLP